MALEGALRGRTLSWIERREHSWGFGFSDGVSINAECPWRILMGGSIRLASADDGHRFGLLGPFDAQEVASELLGGRAITTVLPSLASGDLTVRFDSGAILQLIASSAGYEAWMLDAPGVYIVSRGGD